MYTLHVELKNESERKSVMELLLHRYNEMNEESVIALARVM